MELGAGVLSTFADEAYVVARVTIGSVSEADVVFGVNAPSTEHLDGVRAGATLIGILSPGLSTRVWSRTCPSAR